MLTHVRRAHACAIALATIAACVVASSAPGASSQVVVTADIPNATALDITGCAPDSSGITTFGSVSPGTTTKTWNDCTVQFGSSNDSASLRIAQSDGTGTAMRKPADVLTRTTGTSSGFVSSDSVGGTTWFAMSNAKLRRSTNGGSSWSTEWSVSGAGNFTQITVTSTTNAWVADGSSDVWRTINGNAGTPTWNTTTSPGFSVRGVTATSSADAWVVGSGGAIAHTTTSGGSWTAATSGVTWTINGARSIDADSVVGWGTAGKIVVTSNGTTWRDISLAANCAIKDMALLDDNTMFAACDDGNIYSTTNATNPSPTWTTYATGLPNALMSVKFRDASNGVAVGEDGIALVTANGGSSWSPANTGVSHRLATITYDASTSRYIAGGPGRNALRADSSGATWTSSIATDQSWNTVAPTTDGRAWRAGSGGSIERSVDGGTTWSAQTSNTTSSLFGAYAYDTNRAIAVGRNGAIVTTDDGGVNWVARTSGTSQELRDVVGLNDGVAVAVGWGGTVLRSVDYGHTWTTMTSGVTRVLMKVIAFDNGTVEAFGQKGDATRSADRGTTWSATALPSTNKDVRVAAAMPGTNTGTYLSNGTVYTTTNAGSSWTARATTEVDSFHAMAMPTASKIVIVGAGVIRISTDGGATFGDMTNVNVGAHVVKDIEVVDTTSLMTVGYGNMAGISTTSDPVNDYAIGSSDWTSGVEAFGACLRATTATATWTPNSTCDQSTNGAWWQPVPAGTGVGSEVAKTANGDGLRAANLRFGLRVDPTQPTGAISAGITFVVIAPAA